jgi:hypothetical protein
MTKKEVLIKAGSVMMFAILCIAFFQFFYPYHLFIKEQLQLFLFTSEYFISYLSKPASLASYLGDFFTQFFYLRWGGAIVLALLLCVEWLLIVCLLRKLGAEKNVLLYAFFPIIGEWVLHCGLGYSVSSTITVILCIIIFLLYATIKKRFIAFLVAILLQPILYALLGSGLFTFNLLLLLTDSIRKEKLNLLAYVILFTGILIPFLLRSHYLLTIEQAYIYPHREFMAFVPPLLIIMLAGGMSSREVRIYTSDIRYTPFLFGLQLILLIGGVLSRANFHREKILSLDSEAYFGNWSKVLKQAYFPTISLTGSYGQQSDDLNNILKSTANKWSFGPSLSVPIFDFGRIKQRVSISETDLQSSLVSYEQSVKKAYKEVHDTLAKENLAKSRLAFQEEELKAYQKVLDLSTKRFNQGVANQLEVLDAQKSVLSASLNVVATKQYLLTSQAELFKALGGGWRENDLITAK